ncbi:SDR family oxidoreductase [Pedobacter jejuensis]|uniref:SDR family oxidoreductase n=1 Tax=Pedobacter jejuensis TaxID=1268550 RepID=A0A3N0BXY7_9SPHI|nr:SDR family oxidoreductase [Pedobacter jejuensis]RNL54185.1 SDR family oxidoreductase [Pedobacter jejuensis]
MDLLKEIKTVSILGCGWFGFALAKSLISSGFDVKGSTTTPEKLRTLSAEKIEPYLINFTADSVLTNERFLRTDVLFICIPPKRNSAELNDYPEKIESILEASENKARKVIMISSTSVFGDENKIVNEDSETNSDTDSGKVVLAAEQIFRSLRPNDYTIIRFAGLIGPDRNPGRFFAGKSNVPNGLAPVNLIHQQDAIGIAISILEKQAFGRIYNACSPTHPTKKDFYTKAAREAGLKEPTFLDEKTSWKIVESLNVPEFLGYQFQVTI